MPLENRAFLEREERLGFECWGGLSQQSKLYRLIFFVSIFVVDVVVLGVLSEIAIEIVINWEETRTNSVNRLPNGGLHLPIYSIWKWDG